MKILGLTIHNNLLALIIGLKMIAICLAISYIFQKKLFGKHRRKVPHAMMDKNRWRD